MCEIKRLFDPSGLLNAGTIITDDAEIHLKHIKLNPSVEPEVDRCTACGYCEPVCPSRDLTLTPRQRIAVRREIANLELAGDHAAVARLEKDFDYQVVHTCAVDGMCGTACPLKINTGLLVKKLRRTTIPKPTAAVWTTLAKHWKGTTATFSTVMSLTDALPGPLEVALTGVDKGARAILGKDSIPLWTAELPGGGPPRRRPQPTGEVTAVYLPACVNVMFGPTEGVGVQVSFEALCEQAGVKLLVPEKIESMCCGTPWSSKGIPDGYAEMRERVL